MPAVAKESEGEEGSAMGEREWSIMWYGGSLWDAVKRFVPPHQAVRQMNVNLIIPMLCYSYGPITSRACGIWRLRTETAASGQLIASFVSTSAITCSFRLHFGNQLPPLSPLRQSIASFVSNSG